MQKIIITAKSPRDSSVVVKATIEGNVVFEEWQVEQLRKILGNLFNIPDSFVEIEME